MALNQELITLNEVRGYRDVDASYSTVRFSGFLKSVQDNALKFLLGDALWYDFFKNINDVKYQTLLNGEEYTRGGEVVYYDGLKPFLIWSWLINLPIDGNSHHTQSGDISYLREVSQAPSKYITSQVLENYKENTQGARNDIINYLNEKYTTYTLWDYKPEGEITNLTFDIL